MKYILKPIFELKTGEFELFGNILYNYIAMGIIGLIAFAVAFEVVGKLYANDMISGRTSGSIIHWIVRLVVFIVLFYVFSLFIWLIKFIISIPWWVWLIVSIVFVAVIGISFIFRRKSSKVR
ncbi:MAG: hypothetical protein LBM16_01045 [Clostridiales bacterium]|jgi:hypothetical protein|nr:hypothetical protein [Clostridiales bacterium]